MENLPSIEIACIGLPQPSPIRAAGFTVECEAGLESQRLPARFRAEFGRTAGCLYRLGAPSRRAVRPPILSAYELLSAECRERFPASQLQFAAAHTAEIARVLAAILSASPRREALFTSDWQFGPESAHRFGPVTAAEFWQLHEAGALYLNAAYALTA